MGGETQLWIQVYGVTIYAKDLEPGSDLAKKMKQSARQAAAAREKKEEKQKAAKEGRIKAEAAEAQKTPEEKAAEQQQQAEERRRRDDLAMRQYSAQQQNYHRLSVSIEARDAEYSSPRRGEQERAGRGSKTAVSVQVSFQPSWSMPQKPSSPPLYAVPHIQVAPQTQVMPQADVVQAQTIPFAQTYQDPGSPPPAYSTSEDSTASRYAPPVHVGTYAYAVPTYPTHQQPVYMPPFQPYPAFAYQQPMYFATPVYHLNYQAPGFMPPTYPIAYPPPPFGTQAYSGYPGPVYLATPVSGIDRPFQQQFGHPAQQQFDRPPEPQPQARGAPERPAYVQPQTGSYRPDLAGVPRQEGKASTQRSSPISEFNVYAFRYMSIEKKRAYFLNATNDVRRQILNLPYGWFNEPLYLTGTGPDFLEALYNQDMNSNTRGFMEILETSQNPEALFRSLKNYQRARIISHEFASNHRENIIKLNKYLGQDEDANVYRTRLLLNDKVFSEKAKGDFFFNIMSGAQRDAVFAIMKESMYSAKLVKFYNNLTAEHQANLLTEHICRDTKNQKDLELAQRCFFEKNREVDAAKQAATLKELMNIKNDPNAQDLASRIFSDRRCTVEFQINTLAGVSSSQAATLFASLTNDYGFLRDSAFERRMRLLTSEKIPMENRLAMFRDGVKSDEEKVKFLAALADGNAEKRKIAIALFRDSIDNPQEGKPALNSTFVIESVIKQKGIRTAAILFNAISDKPNLQAEILQNMTSKEDRAALFRRVDDAKNQAQILMYCEMDKQLELFLSLKNDESQQKKIFNHLGDAMPGEGRSVGAQRQAVLLHELFEKDMEVAKVAFSGVEDPERQADILLNLEKPGADWSEEAKQKFGIEKAYTYSNKIDELFKAVNDGDQQAKILEKILKEKEIFAVTLFSNLADPEQQSKILASDSLSPEHQLTLFKALSENDRAKVFAVEGSFFSGVFGSAPLSDDQKAELFNRLSTQEQKKLLTNNPGGDYTLSEAQAGKLFASMSPSEQATLIKELLLEDPLRAKGIFRGIDNPALQAKLIENLDDDNNKRTLFDALPLEQQKKVFGQLEHENNQLLLLQHAFKNYDVSSVQQIFNGVSNPARQASLLQCQEPDPRFPDQLLPNQLTRDQKYALFNGLEPGFFGNKQVDVLNAMKNKDSFELKVDLLAHTDDDKLQKIFNQRTWSGLYSGQRELEGAHDLFRGLAMQDSAKALAVLETGRSMPTDKAELHDIGKAPLKCAGDYYLKQLAADAVKEKVEGKIVPNDSTKALVKLLAGKNEDKETDERALEAFKRLDNLDASHEVLQALEKNYLKAFGKLGQLELVPEAQRDKAEYREALAEFQNLNGRYREYQNIYFQQCGKYPQQVVQNSHHSNGNGRGLSIALGQMALTFSRSRASEREEEEKQYELHTMGRPTTPSMGMPRQ